MFRGVVISDFPVFFVLFYYPFNCKLAVEINRICEQADNMI